MTPETVRHYGKRARAYMIAKGAAEKMTSVSVTSMTPKGWGNSNPSSGGT